jgi:hypothetical protein
MTLLEFVNAMNDVGVNVLPYLAKNVDLVGAFEKCAEARVDVAPFVVACSNSGVCLAAPLATCASAGEDVAACLAGCACAGDQLPAVLARCVAAGVDVAPLIAAFARVGHGLLEKCHPVFAAIVNRWLNVVVDIVNGDPGATCALATPRRRTVLHAAVLARDSNILGYLCGVRPDLMWVPDADGRTPMHLAAALGFGAAVMYLATWCPAAMFLQDNDSKLPIHLLVDQVHVGALLAEMSRALSIVPSTEMGREQESEPEMRVEESQPRPLVGEHRGREPPSEREPEPEPEPQPQPLQQAEMGERGASESNENEAPRPLWRPSTTSKRRPYAPLVEWRRRGAGAVP